MADEMADVSNKEQLVVCIRWVDDDLAVHKDSVGLHPLKDTSTDYIFSVIKGQIFSHFDSCFSVNLSLKDLSKSYRFHNW